MTKSGELNWTAVLLRLNVIAKERPRNRLKLKQHLMRAPEQLCPLAIPVALENDEPLGSILAEVVAEVRNPALAVEIYELIPERTVVLARLSVEATRQCLEAIRGGTRESDLERGSLLNNLAVRLAGTGHYEQALHAARQAVRFYRGRAKTDPETFVPYLAMSLITLSVRQADCGLHRIALVTARKAVMFCGRLSREKPVDHAEDLALALMTLANRYSAVGKGEESLRIQRQAASIYQLLAQADKRHERDYALSLYNITNRLTELGRHEQALSPGEETIHHYRKLEANERDSFYESTAAALNTHSVNLTHCGRAQRAFECAEEAVDRFQQLYQNQSARFLVDLVTGLNNLAGCQGDLDQPSEALKTARQAVEFAELLRRQQREVGTQHLATSLTNLAHWCLLVGRHPEASRVAERCVGIARPMVRQRPELRMALVNALIHWSEALRLSRRRTKALRLARESVSLARPLARENMLAFGPRFGSALGLLSRCEAEIGKHEDALRHQQAQVQLNRRLCQESAPVHEPHLAFALANLATRFLVAKRTREARKTVEDCLGLFGKISVRTPNLYHHERAVALQIAAQIHTAMGDKHTATELRKQAKLVTGRRKSDSNEPG